MAFYQARCTTCGTVFGVDNTSDAVVCPSCATPIIVAKAIQAFAQHGDGVFLEENINKANTFLTLSDWDKAKTLFEELSDQYPHDARIWLGIARAISHERNNHNISGDELDTVVMHVDRARKLNVYIADNDWDVYIENERDRIDTQHRIREQNRKKLQNEYDSLVTRTSVQLKYTEKQKHTKKNTRIGLGVTLLGLAAIAGACWYFIEALHVMWMLAAAIPIGCIGFILFVAGLCTRTHTIALPTEYVQDIQRTVDRIKASAERNGVTIDMRAPIQTSIHRKKGK